MKNSVAVLLPVYKKDNDKYLKDSVDSIIKQSWRSFHLYIGVDGPIGNSLNEYLNHIKSHEKITIIK